MSAPQRKRFRQKKHPRIPYVYVKAPRILSVVRNPEDVSAFILEIKICFDGKIPVWVVLEDVEEIDYDAITVMLSAVVRFKTSRIQFNGDFPKNGDVKKILDESGFFGYLLKSKFGDKQNYKLESKSSIFTHAMRTVDSELGEDIIKSASTTVWKERRRCPGVQRTLIELMQNTNNHASLEREGEKHWWLSVQHISSERRVLFSFVDYGVGVFVNLENKRQGNKFYRILDRLRDKFSHGSNADILKLIFHGELHRTASGKTFRGKGLPGIYEAFSKNRISKFVMITNNVYFNSEGDTYKILKHPFQGTFVYWELREADSSLTYETKNID